MTPVAKLLIAIGLLFIIMGVLTGLFGNLLAWFGKLPGDFHYQNGHFSVYAPLGSMIVISIIINILLYIFSKF